VELDDPVVADEKLSDSELLEAWPVLSTEDRVEGFEILSREQAERIFDQLSARDQAELLLALPLGERRIWMRYLSPDDAADLIQEAAQQQREQLLATLDDAARREILALLAYKEDEAGGLMNPRYARLRPEMTVDQALSYLRRQSRQQTENIYYAYVLDADQKLVGVVSLRELVSSPPGRTVRELMKPDVVRVNEQMDQEAVSNVFAANDLVMLPVVDDQGRMKGVVTADDIVDVVREEATEDIQKMGGTAALDAPYLQVAPFEMLRKRGVWLALLLLAEFFTVAAMHQSQDKLQAVLVLAIFIPLIIASGGNCGSQAATLVVRAMALGELRLRDWWRVARRELAMGLTLGSTLAAIAFAMVYVWHALSTELGQHFLLIGAVVAASIVAVSAWGTLLGSMLPFALRSFGLDPASASTPLVATILDGTGMVIYFAVAGLLLRGTLL